MNGLLHLKKTPGTFFSFEFQPRAKKMLDVGLQDLTPIFMGRSEISTKSRW
jgi:hypothetical protein